MNKQQLSKHCGKLRAAHKTVETRKRIIERDAKGFPKLIDSYRCEDNKNYDENVALMNEMELLYNARNKYRNDCVDKVDWDKGHNKIINAYSNRLKQCKKIVQKQKPKSPKKKRKRKSKGKKEMDKLNKAFKKISLHEMDFSD